MTMQTIDIAIDGRQTTAYITVRHPRGGPGTTRRYRNVSKASIARLMRVAQFSVVHGAYRATVTK